MNQVFFNEARVALDGSKRISSPSSACAEEKKVRTLMNHRCEPHAYDVDIFSLHDQVDHLPRDRVTFLVVPNPSAEVHLDLVDPAHDTIAIISSVLYHATQSRLHLPSFGPPVEPIDFPTLPFSHLA